jgi:hypothetical protein
MKRRIAKKILKYAIVGKIVSRNDLSTHLGVGIMAIHPEHKVIEALKKFPESEDYITWRDNTRYKRSKDV